VLAKIAKLKTAKLPLVKGKPRLGCPVSHVGKFIAIGLNYAESRERGRHATTQRAHHFLESHKLYPRRQ
jgi:hypothetical protein